MDGGQPGYRLRKALGAVPSGVVVATARTQQGGKLGMTVSSFVSVSLQPPLVLFCIDRASAALEEWLAVPGFVVNVLADSQQWLAMQFARRHADKWARVAHADGRHGAPLLAGTAASFQCDTCQRMDCGDHVILVGQVEEFTHDPELTALGFYRGRLRAFPAGWDTGAPLMTDWPLSMHY